MRSTFLFPVFLMTFFFSSIAVVAAAPIKEEWGVINKRTMIKTGTTLITQENSTKELWEWTICHLPKGYAYIVKYKVKPGAKYTLYSLYYTGVPKVTRNAPYLDVRAYTFNPLSEQKRKKGISSSRGGPLYKTKTGWAAYRENFSVDPKSTGNTLYLVFTSRKPNWKMGCILKSPPDSDKEVEDSTYNPYTDRKHNHWGRLLKKPFFFERLKGDSTSEEQSPGDTVSGQPITETPADIVTGQPTIKPKPKTSRSSDIGPSIPHAGQVEYNSTIKAVMGPRDYDMFKFDWPGGEFLCYSTGNLDLVADVFDENGKKLDRDYDSGEGKNFRFEGYLAPGTYGIQVRVMYYRGEGPYTIVFGDGSMKTEEKYLYHVPVKQDNAF